MIFRVALFALVGIMSAVLTFWIIDDQVPSTITRAEVVNPVVAPGEVLKVRFYVVRHRRCTVKVDRFVEDSIGTQTTYAASDYIMMPGGIGEDSSVVPITIPRAMEQGPAKYLSVRSYRCNPLHYIWPIVVDGPVVNFVVQGQPVPMPVEIK